MLINIYIYLIWNYTIKEAFNQPRYGRLYNYEYSIILGSNNNCIIMNFLYDGIYNMEYSCIHITILDGNFMNMPLIINKVNYSYIDADDTS